MGADDGLHLVDRADYFQQRFQETDNDQLDAEVVQGLIVE